MTAPAAAYPSRPRRRWIWASVATVTAMALVVPAALRMTLKGEIRHELVPMTLFQQPVSELQVDAPGQSVTIRRGPAGRVTVMSDVSWLVGKPAIRHAWHGRQLQIRASCPSFNVFGDCQVGLVIGVPADVAVRASVGSGSVTVLGLAGPVHVTATSGSVQLEDVSGPTWASATSGNIGTSGLSSSRVMASVTSGQLALRFAAPPETVSVSVGAGVAAVTVPPGSHYRVLGQRGSGYLTIAPGLSQLRATSVIALVIGSGRLGVGYRRAAPPAPPGADDCAPASLLGKPLAGCRLSN